MKPEIQNIASQALRLPSAARAQLAEILLESLDFEDDFPISKEWMDEIDRRRKQIDSGDVELIDGETALAELRKKYFETV